jgi:predicted transcriptional regulator YdeE
MVIYVKKERGIVTMNSTLQTKTISLKSFNFIGKAARTTNQAEATGEGVIPAMNKLFFEEQLMDIIPNKNNNDVLALYTEYESDETGAYEYALGTMVDEHSSAPDGMEKFHVPGQKYVVFTTKKGPLREVIIEAWQHIWEWSKMNKRAFTADFERYDDRSRDPENGQAEIFISIEG